MSGGQLDRAVHERGERPAPVRTADAATAVFLTALALGLATTILFVVKVGYLVSLAVTALVIAAVLFGPTHGLLAVAAALIAYRLHAHRPASAWDARALEVMLVTLAALAIPWSGRYITEVRRERRSPDGSPPERRPNFTRLRDALADFARRRTFGFSWRLTLGSARVGFVPFVILGAATLAGVLVRGSMGPEGAVSPTATRLQFGAISPTRTWL
jgi:hypothetical protein